MRKFSGQSNIYQKLELNIKKAFKLDVVCLWLILVIQVLGLVYWGCRKSNYYWDELYSFETAHYFASTTPARSKLTESDLYLNNLDTWVSVGFLKETYMVTSESSVLNDTLIHNIKQFFYSKSYMILLNLVETFFFQGQLSKWSGIILNILFFIIGQIFLYILVKEITRNKWVAYLSILMYGFCGMAVSMVVFVRFYAYISALLVLFTYYQYKIWKEKIWQKNLIYEILSMLFLYLAYKNSPLVCPYAAGLILGVLLGLLFGKKYKAFWSYVLTVCLGSLAYIFLKTNYIQMLFFPKEEYAAATGVNEMGIRNMLGFFSWKELIWRLVISFQVYGKLLFGNIAMLCLWGILFIALIVACIKRKREKNLLLGHNIENKGFVFILFGAVLLFIFFSIYLGFGTSVRYYSPVFPELAAVLVISVWLMGKMIDKGRLVFNLLAALIIASSIITFAVPQIENLYLDDKATVEAIRKENVNSVVWEYTSRVPGTCVALANKDSMVYFCSDTSLNCDAFPDVFMLWTNKDMDDQMRDMLEKQGYFSITEIGELYVCNIYLCAQ